jgi:hypothetical protein
MADSSDYRRAYEAAQRELAELLQIQEGLEKRITLVRQNVQSLKELCESEDIKISPSLEAKYLLENSALPDEIAYILSARYPDELRPTDVRQQLERLGHDLSTYTNPMATIHMVLKRLTEAGRIRERQHSQGFKVYQFRPRTLPRLDGSIDPEKVPERIREYIFGTVLAERTRSKK